MVAGILIVRLDFALAIVYIFAFLASCKDIDYPYHPQVCGRGVHDP